VSYKSTASLVIKDMQIKAIFNILLDLLSHHWGFLFRKTILEKQSSPKVVVKPE
jgi:hypothetical protein